MEPAATATPAAWRHLGREEFGDTHISLDRIKDGTIKARDLRLRFEFGGGAAEQDIALPAALAASVHIPAGDIGLDIAVPYARWGDATGRWAPQAMPLFLIYGLNRRIIALEAGLAARVQLPLAMKLLPR
ncbi:MAG: hypothetical protein ABSE73_24965 [Planctomycetota bacterium]